MHDAPSQHLNTGCLRRPLIKLTRRRFELGTTVLPETPTAADKPVSVAAIVRGNP